MSDPKRPSSMAMPASVLSYFTDRATRMATDLLLAKKRPILPEDIRWDDLRGFYKANLAAKQIEVEHAIFLGDLWEAVCQPMPSPWTFPQPHQQGDDCAMDLVSVWNESCFSREFFRGEWACEIVTCVGAEEGVQIGYGLWRDGEPMLAAALSDDWESPDEILWSREGLIPLSPVIDLPALQNLANEGRQAVFDVVKDHWKDS